MAKCRPIVLSRCFTVGKMKSKLDALINDIEQADIPEADKLLFYKNAGQIFVIQYQIKAGLISNLLEFFANGGGELFHMVVNKEITLDIEWHSVREDLKKILASGQGES